MSTNIGTPAVPLALDAAASPGERFRGRYQSVYEAARADIARRRIWTIATYPRDEADRLAALDREEASLEHTFASS